MMEPHRRTYRHRSLLVLMEECHQNILCLYSSLISPSLESSTSTQHSRWCPPTAIRTQFIPTQLHWYNHIKWWSRLKNDQNHAQFTKSPPLNVVVSTEEDCNVNPL